MSSFLGWQRMRFLTVVALIACFAGRASGAPRAEVVDFDVTGDGQTSTALRVTSLALILLTCGKVFLYDLAHLSDLYRVASLAGLAMSLIVVSLAYKKFVFPTARVEEVSS